jgi:hypothetical protein
VTPCVQKQLAEGSCAAPIHPKQLPVPGLVEAGMTRADVLAVLQAGMATSLLHMESRIVSMLGHGFYTIGPCGTSRGKQRTARTMHYATCCMHLPCFGVASTLSAPRDAHTNVGVTTTDVTCSSSP